MAFCHSNHSAKKRPGEINGTLSLEKTKLLHLARSFYSIVSNDACMTLVSASGIELKKGLVITFVDLLSVDVASASNVSITEMGVLLFLLKNGFCTVAG